MASNKTKTNSKRNEAREFYYSKNYQSTQTFLRKKTTQKKKTVGSKQRHWMIHWKKKHRRGQNRLTGKKMEKCE